MLTAYDRIRIILGGGPSDTLLNLFLENAKDIILDYIGRNELPERLISVQVDLAVIAFNRMGTEGETARSEGGISQSFITGMPKEIEARLKNYPRKVGYIHEINGEQKN